MTESNEKNGDWQGPYTLESVTVRIEYRNGEEIRCLCLKFKEDGQEERKRHIWEDKQVGRESLPEYQDHAIVSRATSLIGCKVKITTWEPDEYSPDKWWQKICKAD